MLTKKLSIDKIASAIRNKRVLVRVDFNVPVKNGIVTDKTRIEESLKTIKFALDNGAKNVALITHFGRPNGQKNLKYSVKPVIEPLSQLLNREVHFLNDCVGQDVIDTVKKGDGGKVFLLENLRFYAAEEGSSLKEDGTKVKESKDVITKFRSELSQLGDLYVNDAFGTCHRAHSSIVGIDLPSRSAGFLLKKELDYFAKIIENPEKPVLVIMGGAKVKDKILLINHLLERVNKMCITGGMAYTFLKAMNLMSIGQSICDQDGLKVVADIIQKAKDRNVELHFPKDFVIVKEFKDGVDTKIVTLQQGIPDDYLGIDTGPETQKEFHQVIQNSKTIFINGSAGVFEFKIGKEGSYGLVRSIVEATKNGSTSVCGGGDTVSLINSVEGARNSFSHISTGGGASLELLEGKILPGIQALSDL